ncbi:MULTISPECIES: methyltransferase domain-containing protein [Moorena]|uniref:Methylase involved in ubiquinone/menaquinone biosynthesis n=1 Tax=Moorena producens 3L TaxID=489825 RepID=F4XYU0_9CYAN|nr:MULTISPECIES: methyltransferase domain-containing protein [Moorena]EGJ30231.1 methylase involved in ubiquinone/menaquinone biosynthesis [Moorena producens 3L]NEP34739.1 methyltransferase domain-containing protein [Moorena sp. SIO3B2]NEP65076.1 methyltransferase domain-containing protein [Moorena sp. SIO3A5]NER91511.1 methyltransferase domain-containing protein [Moorena sp. SIO3A2]NES40512.1 methyltransferase domain-containing protein [Moorena sp. SIO2C4]
MDSCYSEAVQIAETYYNNIETDRIYKMIWGGEHIHFGIYLEPDDSILEASQRIVNMMATMLQQIGENSQVIDLGAGYGGTARYLAKKYGCFVSCLNLSELQNQRNLEMNQAQNLNHRIEVKQGNFENIPHDDRSFDIVWSQDSMVHSGNRRQVLSEIRRILKPGGELIFTDTLRNHDCSPEKLQPAFNRLQIKDAGSFHFYKKTLQELGFEEIQVIDLSRHVSTHYIRFRDEILKRYEEIIEQISKEAIDKTLKSIEPWINFYQEGDMQWGGFHYCLSNN